MKLTAQNLENLQNLAYFFEQNELTMNLEEP